MVEHLTPILTPVLFLPSAVFRKVDLGVFVLTKGDCYMSRYARIISQPVPQTESLTDNQVKNNAGGYVFALDKWKRLDRFLILGSDSNTYYQTAKQLTRENAKCVSECLAEDAPRAVARIVEISHEGRAPKNDAAIFALALAAADQNVKTRQLALSELPQVCRTSTHLFQFVGNCQALKRGWGRAMKRAVARWYDSRTPASVAFQAVKYRAREGYTHKRLLETARPYAEANKSVYAWMKGKPVEVLALPSVIQGHLQAMENASSPKEVARIITDHRLPWEAVPTEVTKDLDVWRALLPEMGLTALIRNLGGMTSYGTLKPLSKEVALVVERLGDQKLLSEARIHPFNVLVAHAAYRSGTGGAARYGRAAREWKPIPQIVDALEKAFYASFKYVRPSGKRTLIGLDVSGSMSSPLMNSALSVCEGAAAMAMTVTRTEPSWHVHAFANTFRELPLTASMSLEQVLKHTKDVNFGGTDCSLPMLYAAQHRLEVDTFMVFTDNETYAGRMHPVEALRAYRKQSGINAKLVVAGMTSTGFTIADPNDPGMLDVVGFDSAAPSIMAEFSRG